MKKIKTLFSKILWFGTTVVNVPYRELTIKQIYIWYLGLFSAKSHARQIDGKSKPKQCYTKASALKAKDAMEKKNVGSKFDAYKCIHCEHWHIGNRNF